MKAPILALSIGFVVNHLTSCHAFTSNSVPTVDRRSQLDAATSLPLGDANLQRVETKEEQPNVGVLLLNLGGPEKTDDVEGMRRTEIGSA